MLEINDLKIWHYFNNLARALGGGDKVSLEEKVHHDKALEDVCMHVCITPNTPATEPNCLTGLRQRRR